MVDDRLDGEARSAATGCGRGRIVDFEHPAHQIVNEVDLGTAQQIERDRIDRNRRAGALDHEIIAGFCRRKAVGIGKPRAAAAVDANAQKRARRLAH
jgi:hypothetical protein